MIKNSILALLKNCERNDSGIKESDLYKCGHNSDGNVDDTISEMIKDKILMKLPCDANNDQCYILHPCFSFPKVKKLI